MQYGNPTRHGAAVVVRTARGTGRKTFSIKYVDAGGQLAWERLGTDEDGWTRPKAKAELEQRLVDVRREGLRRPSGMTFGELAEQWYATYPTAKQLKHSTDVGYRSIVRNHLVPHLGHLTLDRLDVATLDRYVADRLREGCEGSSVNRHLNVVSLIVRSARKQGLMRDNPVELVDRPKEPRRSWRILTPPEIARVRTAYLELERDAADDDERAWVRQSRQVFLVVYGSAIRRGELLGLRWGRVRLADPEGPVVRIEETFVRDRIDTPKSDASERTIPLGPVVAETYYERYADTAYQHDTDRVFCHPGTGGPFDHRRHAETFKAALAKAGITDRVRPFHDGRHTSITNQAAAGVAPTAIQAAAGHGDYGTTQRYINLAGVTFRAEAELAERRMFGTAAAEPNGEIG